MCRTYEHMWIYLIVKRQRFSSIKIKKHPIHEQVVRRFFRVSTKIKKRPKGAYISQSLREALQKATCFAEVLEYEYSDTFRQAYAPDSRASRAYFLFMPWKILRSSPKTFPRKVS